MMEESQNEDRIFRFSHYVALGWAPRQLLKLRNCGPKIRPSIRPAVPRDPGTRSTVSNTNLRCNFTHSPTVSQKAAATGGKNSQSNRPLHLGGFRQLGVQNLTNPQPGGNGGRCRHHPAQTTDH